MYTQPSAIAGLAIGQAIDSRSPDRFSHFLMTLFLHQRTKICPSHYAQWIENKLNYYSSIKHYIFYVYIIITGLIEASPSEGVLSTLGPKITLLHNINFQTLCFINIH